MLFLFLMLERFVFFFINLHKHLWKLIYPSSNPILYVCISTKIGMSTCECMLYISACLGFFIVCQVVFYLGSNLNIMQRENFLFQYLLVCVCSNIGGSDYWFILFNLFVAWLLWYNSCRQWLKGFLPCSEIRIIGLGSFWVDGLVFFSKHGTDMMSSSRIFGGFRTWFTYFVINILHKIPAWCG